MTAAYLVDCQETLAGENITQGFSAHRIVSIYYLIQTKNARAIMTVFGI